MNLKERWNSKNELKTKKFTFLEQEIEIRELTGFEKEKIDNEKDKIKAQFLMYDFSVQTEDIRLNENEFRHAYEYSHAEVDYILAEILTFSCLTEKASEELEGN